MGAVRDDPCEFCWYAAEVQIPGEKDIDAVIDRLEESGIGAERAERIAEGVEIIFEFGVSGD